MEKYRQSRRWLSVLVLACLVLFHISALFEDFGHSSSDLEGEAYVLQSSIEERDAAVEQQKAVPADTDCHIRNIADWQMSNRHFKRNRSLELLSVQIAYLSIGMFLAGNTFRNRFCIGVPFLHRHKRLRSLQEQDGKKRQKCSKQNILASYRG